MDIYFELHEAAVHNMFNGHQYLVKRNATKGQLMSPNWLNATFHAQRIWEENDGKIRFIKNRYTNDNNVTDLKEFFWVKLSAVEI